MQSIDFRYTLHRTCCERRAQQCSAALSLALWVASLVRDPVVSLCHPAVSPAVTRRITEKAADSSRIRHRSDGPRRRSAQVQLHLRVSLRGGRVLATPVPCSSQTHFDSETPLHPRSTQPRAHGERSARHELHGCEEPGQLGSNLSPIHGAGCSRLFLGTAVYP